MRTRLLLLWGTQGVLTMQGPEQPGPSCRSPRDAGTLTSDPHPHVGAGGDRGHTDGRTDVGRTGPAPVGAHSAE